MLLVWSTTVHLLHLVTWRITRLGIKNSKYDDNNSNNNNVIYRYVGTPKMQTRKIGLPLSGTKLFRCSSSRDTWVIIEDASI